MIFQKLLDGQTAGPDPGVTVYKLQRQHPNLDPCKNVISRILLLNLSVYLENTKVRWTNQQVSMLSIHSKLCVLFMLTGMYR